MNSEAHDGSAAPGVARLDHANLVVRDLDAAIAFYQDLLGLRVVLRRQLSGPWIGTVVGQPGAVMDCAILAAPEGSARLELLAYQQPAPLDNKGGEQPHRLGLRHIAFAVTDLDRLWARLAAAGVTCLSEPVSVPFAVAGWRKRLAYLLDPEGVLLELAEYEELNMELVITVPDMMCAACAAKITEALKGTAGVAEVAAEPAAKKVRVSGDVTPEAAKAAIRGAGFTPSD